MKKTTRVLVALLALTLVTSCFVGGTFAKYVISDASNDAARVAKFGAVITVTDDGMFKSTYATDDTTADASITHSVTSANGTDKLVAPGTEGTLTSVVLSGTSEVATRVTNTAVLTLDGWTVEGAEYCPIEITVGTTTYKVGENGIADIAGLKTAVEGAIAGYKAEYAPNAAFDAVAAPVVKWAWDFEGNDDTMDTKLGQAGTATIALDITTTVTQID